MKLTEYWQIYRDQIEHEDNLINARMQWLIFSQTLLFTGYAALANIQHINQKSFIFFSFTLYLELRIFLTIVIVSIILSIIFPALIFCIRFIKRLIIQFIVVLLFLVVLIILLIFLFIFPQISIFNIIELLGFFSTLFSFSSILAAYQSIKDLETKFENLRKHLETQYIINKNIINNLPSIIGNKETNYLGLVATFGIPILFLTFWLILFLNSPNFSIRN